MIHYDADHEWNMIMYRCHLSSQFPCSLPEKAMMRYTYQFDKALQRMEAENVPQSSVTVSAIMSNCKENNDWAQAECRRTETGRNRGSPPWPFCFGCASVCVSLLVFFEAHVLEIKSRCMVHPIDYMQIHLPVHVHCFVFFDFHV